jgi:integrase
MADYLKWYAIHRRSLDQTRIAVQAHILPIFGRRQVATLTARQIREWHEGLAQTPARLRSKSGPKAKDFSGPETKRKRKATANRLLTVLKAALNFGFSEGRVQTDLAWRRVRPFRGVEAAKVRYLDDEQAGQLLNACDPEFRDLVRAALLTGCRYSELVSLKVEDYKPDARALQVRVSKSSQARHVYLSDQAAAFFEARVANRRGGETLLPRSDGTPWGRGHQSRRMSLACKAAGIEPEISFHILRHTYASHYLMNGGSLPALAAQLGHGDTRMTIKHYGHLGDSWRAEEARRHAPDYGLLAAEATT